MIRVSIYRNSYDTQGAVVSLESIVQRIRTGARGLIEKTRYCHALAISDPETYRAYKEKELPAPTFSGIFPKKKRQGKSISKHSGLVVIDVDGLTAEQIAELLAGLAENPYVVLAFISPSGNGIKVIFRVDPIPADFREHKGAYTEAKAFLDGEAEQLGFEVDTSGSDCNRLCYLAYDPQAIYNPEAPSIDWDIEAWRTAEREQTERREQVIRESDDLPADATALDFIPNDCDYETWRNVGMAIKDAGFGVEVFQRWSGGRRKRSTGEWVAEDIQTHWNRYNASGITWGSVVHLAKQNGYEGFPKQTQRKTVRLKDVRFRFESVLDPIEKAREFLIDFLKSAKNLFALRTDTGTGKTETAITYALKKQVVLGMGNTNLASEVTERAWEKHIKAFRFRGIASDDASDGYMPCVHRERFKILRDKGFNPYLWVCGACDVSSECKQRGYLSQPQQARDANLVALPFPMAFLDPRLRRFAKLYKPTGRDALIFHDDIPIGSLFYEVKLSQGRLRQLAADWQGTPAATWAKTMLRCMAERKWEALKRFSFPARDISEVVTEALTHVLDPLSGAIVTPEDYIKNPSVDISTNEACAKLPQVDSEAFDTLMLLQRFWTRYPRVADAPFIYDVPTETFTFSLPPEPYQDRRKTLKLGFASATLDKSLMERIFPGIAFYDTNRTEWAEGARFYQLSTNRNPRATVLLPSDQQEETCLSRTGIEYYERAIDFIKANPNERHAVISYKQVIDEKKQELDALGVVSAWYGNLAGLDTEFDGVRYFHILFAPYVQPSDIDHLAKQIFGNETEPLIRDADSELSRGEDGEYADARVASIFDALVVGEVLQAIGRARLNLYPNSVIFYSSLFHRLGDEPKWRGVV